MSTQKALRIYFLPLILLGLLILALFLCALCPNKNEMLTASSVESLPAFRVTSLLHPEKSFSDKDLLGHVSLLNIWASWCYPCHVEAPLLLKISGQYNVAMYSLNYKDGSVAAKAWLQKHGDPYVMTGMDTSGSVASSLGAIGTPQILLIDKNGIIRYRHAGALTLRIWQETLWPLVQEYQNK